MIITEVLSAKKLNSLFLIKEIFCWYVAILGHIFYMYNMFELFRLVHIWLEEWKFMHTWKFFVLMRLSFALCSPHKQVLVLFVGDENLRICSWVAIFAIFDKSIPIAWTLLYCHGHAITARIFRCFIIITLINKYASFSMDLLKFESVLCSWCSWLYSRTQISDIRQFCVSTHCCL